MKIKLTNENDSVVIEKSNGTSSDVATKADISALTKSDIGLGNVDNTADVNKNVLTAKRILPLATLANNGAGMTVAQVKTWIANQFDAVNTQSFGDYVYVSADVVGNWSDDNHTVVESSVYAFIKIGGGYNASTYGQWMISSYNDAPIGFVGRSGGTWTSIKVIATTDTCLPTSGGTLNGTLTISPSNTSGHQEGITLYDAGGGGGESLRLRFTSSAYPNGVFLSANGNLSNLMVNDQYELIHGGNIGSQSVNHASTASTANTAYMLAPYAELSDDNGLGGEVGDIKEEIVDYFVGEDLDVGSFMWIPEDFLHHLDEDDQYQTDPNSGLVRIICIGGGGISDTTTMEFLTFDHDYSKLGILRIPTDGDDGSWYFSRLAYSMDIPSSLPASDVHSWAKASTKPSYTASEVGISYSVQAITSNTSSSCSITGSSNDGKSQTIIYTNSTSADLTVTVPTTYKTPDGAAIELTCKAGGYCEVNYLNIGGTIYARGL